MVVLRTHVRLSNPDVFSDLLRVAPAGAYMRSPQIPRGGPSPGSDLRGYLFARGGSNDGSIGHDAASGSETRVD